MVLEAVTASSAAFEQLLTLGHDLRGGLPGLYGALDLLGRELDDAALHLLAGLADALGGLTNRGRALARLGEEDTPLGHDGLLGGGLRAPAARALLGAEDLHIDLGLLGPLRVERGDGALVLLRLGEDLRRQVGVIAAQRLEPAVDAGDDLARAPLVLLCGDERDLRLVSLGSGRVEGGAELVQPSAEGGVVLEHGRSLAACAAHLPLGPPLLALEHQKAPDPLVAGAADD